MEKEEKVVDTAATDTEQGTAVAVFTPAQVQIPGVAGQIDVKMLNTIIESLATHTAPLSKDDIDTAKEAIQEWKTNVVNKLQVNIDLATRLSNIVTKGALDDEMVDYVAQVTKTEDLLEAYRNELDNCTIVAQDVPDEPEFAVTDTEEDRLKMRYAYEAEKEVARQKRYQAEAKARNAMRKFTKAVIAAPESDAIRKACQTYIRKARKLLADAGNKATMASINVGISDADTRKNLMDLMEFTNNL